MPKAKLNQQILSWFTVHPWLKFIAFILAIVVWFYVRGEISRFNY